MNILDYLDELLAPEGTLPAPLTPEAQAHTNEMAAWKKELFPEPLKYSPWSAALGAVSDNLMAPREWGDDRSLWGEVTGAVAAGGKGYRLEAERSQKDRQASASNKLEALLGVGKLQNNQEATEARFEAAMARNAVANAQLGINQQKADIWQQAVNDRAEKYRTDAIDRANKQVTDAKLRWSGQAIDKRQLAETMYQNESTRLGLDDPYKKIAGGDAEIQVRRDALALYWTQVQNDPWFAEAFATAPSPGATVPREPIGGTRQKTATPARPDIKLRDPKGKLRTVRFNPKTGKYDIPVD